jgi:cytochrome c biogenesis protein CcmG/thiol:disulfide interchange protein DsbE
LKIGLAAVAAALVAGSIIAALSFSSSSPTIPLLDLPVPSFSLQNLVRGGPDITAAGLRRSQAVVVNFWGSWCPPCDKEMPALQAVHRQLGDQVTFVGIDEEDTRTAALGFLREVGVTYPSGFDGNGSVAQDQFHINGTPTTYFIGHGKMLDFHQGRLTKAQLLDDVKKIFGVS